MQHYSTTLRRTHDRRWCKGHRCELGMPLFNEGILETTNLDMFRSSTESSLFNLDMLRSSTEPSPFNLDMFRISTESSPFNFDMFRCSNESSSLI